MDVFSGRRDSDTPGRRLKVDEGETIVIHPSSLADPAVKKLMKVLMDWVNSYTTKDKMIVRDFIGDLYDGQILICLLKHLTGKEIEHHEIAQAESSIKDNIQSVIDFCADNLKIKCYDGEWTADGFYKKDLSAMLYLLVELAKHFKINRPLPPNVKVAAIHRVMKNGAIANHTVVHEITGDEEQVMTTAEVSDGAADAATSTPVATPSDAVPNKLDESDNEEDYLTGEPDVFDQLDSLPEKLEQVKSLLLVFVNKHLNKLNVQVVNMTSQMSDGVYLILLIGSLGGFFVPMHKYHMTPLNDGMRLQNVRLALRLLRDVDCRPKNVRAVDIVAKQDKAVLRTMYILFQKYRYE